MYKELAKRIKGTKNIYILTGAGVSAPSQIPVYGGPNGMWAKLSSEGINPMLLLRRTTIRNSPQDAWNWVYNYKKTVDTAQPNAAHKAILKFQEYCFANNKIMNLVTQNIDGIHAKLINESKTLTPDPVPSVGTPNFGYTPDVIELHGNIHYMRCNNECSRSLYPVPKEFDPKDFPKCPKCKAPMRPHMLLFDEGYEEAYYGAVTAINEGSHSACMIVIGSGLMGQLANCLVYDHVLDGKLTIEMNTEKVIKMDDPCLVHIRESCEKSVPELLNELMTI